MTTDNLDALLQQVRACAQCENLPMGPRPIVQASATSRLLIASQAPGRKAHASGCPFDDASGDRLRGWLGLDRARFYDPALVAIVPMGLCYPGSRPASANSRGGDLGPRTECAKLWRTGVLGQLAGVRLTLVIGRHAMEWHLAGFDGKVTEAVRQWQAWGRGIIPMVHPSPRNNAWLRANPWYERDTIPAIRARVQQALAE